MSNRACPWALSSLTAFISGIPKELDEAAWIDGAGYFRYLASVIGPLAWPSIVIIFLYSLLAVWNDIIGPVVLLASPNLFPVARRRIQLLQFQPERVHVACCGGDDRQFAGSVTVRGLATAIAACHHGDVPLGCRDHRQCAARRARRGLTREATARHYGVAMILRFVRTCHRCLPLYTNRRRAWGTSELPANERGKPYERERRVPTVLSGDNGESRHQSIAGDRSSRGPHCGTRDAAGGIVFTFGTGHSHELAEEVAYRAGGVVPVNPILEPSLTGSTEVGKSEFLERLEGFAPHILDYHHVGKEDVLIIISNSGRNGVPVEMAIEAHERGISGGRADVRSPTRAQVSSSSGLRQETVRARRRRDRQLRSFR